MAVTHEQLAELHTQIGRGNLNKAHLQALLRHEDPFVVERCNLDWRATYEAIGLGYGNIDRTFGLQNAGNNWDIPVASGLSVRRVLDGFAKAGASCSSSVSLDCITHRRGINDGDYVVTVKRSLGPDLSHRGITPTQIIKTCCAHASLTLIEVLLLRLAIYMSTGRSMDPGDFATLCSGTYWPGESMPFVADAPGGNPSRFVIGRRSPSGPTNLCMGPRMVLEIKKVGKQQ